MTPTSVSLLDRLRRSHPDQDDWLKLDDIYRPLIRRWIARVPGLSDEADDLTQEVLIVLVREVPHFERQRLGSFRAWLRVITVNRLRAHRRREDRRAALWLEEAERFLDRLIDPADELTREWDREHDRHVYEKIRAIIRPSFSDRTWEAYERFALHGQPAAEVAREMGISENAVIQAKSRVLKKLREEAGEVLS